MNDVDAFEKVCRLIYANAAEMSFKENVGRAEAALAAILPDMLSRSGVAFALRQIAVVARVVAWAMCCQEDCDGRRGLDDDLEDGDDDPVPAREREAAFLGGGDGRDDL